MIKGSQMSFDESPAANKKDVAADYYDDRLTRNADRQKRKWTDRLSQSKSSMKDGAGRLKNNIEVDESD